MQHKYNVKLGLQYEGYNRHNSVQFKLSRFFCNHPQGFLWYSNAITNDQGYMCASGCGQRCDFNPDYFMFQGNVKPLAGPNPNATKVTTFSKEGTKLEGRLK